MFEILGQNLRSRQHADNVVFVQFSQTVREVCEMKRQTRPRLADNVSPFLLSLVDLFMAFAANYGDIIHAVFPWFQIPEISLMVDVVMLSASLVFSAFRACSTVVIEAFFPKFLPPWVFEFLGVGLHVREKALGPPAK
jgi:hypothetical protein